MKDKRINLTGEIGVSILRLHIQRKIGWIIRDIRETDVGIDANIEQVINGNPTAKYISVQLKTGFGNVHISALGDFIFYFKETHYQYWLSSSIPVIIVLCDPDSDTLYWSQLTRRTIDRTPEGYRVIIDKSSQITEHTKVDFEDLINTYQGESLIPNGFEDWSINEKSEYISELMIECANSLATIRTQIDMLDKYINVMIAKGENFSSTHPYGYTEKTSKSFIAKIAQTYTTQLNICKTRISNEYPIAIETHIEAIRLMEEVLSSNISNLEPLLGLFLTAFIDEREQIVSNIKLLNDVSIHFKNNGMLKNATSDRAERSFSLIVADYSANLKILCDSIDLLISKIKK